MIGKFVEKYQLYILNRVVNSPESDEKFELGSNESFHQGRVEEEGNDEDPTQIMKVVQMKPKKVIRKVAVKVEINLKMKTLIAEILRCNSHQS